MGSRVWSYAEPAYDLTAQQQTPYADAVYAHAKTDQLSLMVPGHGSSKGSAATALDSFFESEITDYDLIQRSALHRKNFACWCKEIRLQRYIFIGIYRKYVP